jgi:hypothetical protein
LWFHHLRFGSNKSGKGSRFGVDQQQDATKTQQGAVQTPPQATGNFPAAPVSAAQTYTPEQQQYFAAANRNFMPAPYPMPYQMDFPDPSRMGVRMGLSFL